MAAPGGTVGATAGAASGGHVFEAIAGGIAFLLLVCSAGTITWAASRLAAKPIVPAQLSQLMVLGSSASQAAPATLPANEVCVNTVCDKIPQGWSESDTNRTRVCAEPSQDQRVETCVGSYTVDKATTGDAELQSNMASEGKQSNISNYSLCYKGGTNSFGGRSGSFGYDCYTVTGTNSYALMNYEFFATDTAGTTVYWLSVSSPQSSYSQWVGDAGVTSMVSTDLNWTLS